MVRYTFYIAMYDVSELLAPAYEVLSDSTVSHAYLLWRKETD